MLIGVLTIQVVGWVDAVAVMDHEGVQDLFPTVYSPSHVLPDISHTLADDRPRCAVRAEAFTVDVL